MMKCYQFFKFIKLIAMYNAVIHRIMEMLVLIFISIFDYL